MAALGSVCFHRQCFYRVMLVCSRMLWAPGSSQVVLWMIRSMTMALAWTASPSLWCQSFFAHWVQMTVVVQSYRRWRRSSSMLRMVPSGGSRSHSSMTKTVRTAYFFRKFMVFGDVRVLCPRFLPSLACRSVSRFVCGAFGLSVYR